MGFPEYIAARENLEIIGQPVITYILFISLLQGLFSILFFLKKNKYYSNLLKCLYINIGLYILGFIFLIWFHVQIYSTVLIEYPAMAKIPVENSRFTIPLWIETEKLYFWAMMTTIFMLTIRDQKKLTSSLSIILSVFSTIVFFFSNPFKDPLPGVNEEISRWYASLISGDMMMFQISGMLYGRITYYYNSTYMWIHPPMLFIAYASLIITAAACIYMLLGNEKIYDTIAYRYAKIGYVLLTAGMLIGYPWAVQAWKDSAWWWDPKISGSIMMWVLYSAYLHAHIYAVKGRLWKTTAMLGVLCFSVLVFTYLLTYIIPGIHSVVQP